MTNISYITANPNTSPSTIPNSNTQSFIILIATISCIVILSLLLWTYIYLTSPSPSRSPSSLPSPRLPTITSPKDQDPDQDPLAQPTPPRSTHRLTLTSWLHAHATRSTHSPTLPLFTANPTDLHLLNDVIWETPSDIPPAKVLSKKPAGWDSSRLDRYLPKPAPVSPRVSRSRSSVKGKDGDAKDSPSLLARRHHKSTKHALALALPAIAAGSADNKKGRGMARSKSEKKQAGTSQDLPAKAKLTISSPRITTPVAARLAERYRLCSPGTAARKLGGSQVSGGVAAASESAEAGAGTGAGTGTGSINAILASGSNITAPVSVDNTTNASGFQSVLSPTIAHRRLLTSGPTIPFSPSTTSTSTAAPANPIPDPVPNSHLAISNTTQSELRQWDRYHWDFHLTGRRLPADYIEARNRKIEAFVRSVGKVSGGQNLGTVAGAGVGMLESARQYIPYRSPSPSPASGASGASAASSSGPGPAIDTNTTSNTNVHTNIHNNHLNPIASATASSSAVRRTGPATNQVAIGSNASDEPADGESGEIGSPGGRAHPGTVWKGEAGW